MGASCCGAQAFLVATQELHCPTACGILVPTSPALEGGFFTTGPLGSPITDVFLASFHILIYYPYFFGWSIYLIIELNSLYILDVSPLVR